MLIVKFRYEGDKYVFQADTVEEAREYLVDYLGEPWAYTAEPDEIYEVEVKEEGPCPESE